MRADRTRTCSFSGTAFTVVFFPASETWEGSHPLLKAGHEHPACGAGKSPSPGMVLRDGKEHGSGPNWRPRVPQKWLGAVEREKGRAPAIQREFWGCFFSHTDPTWPSWQLKPHGAAVPRASSPSPVPGAQHPDAACWGWCGAEPTEGTGWALPIPASHPRTPKPSGICLRLGQG